MVAVLGGTLFYQTGVVVEQDRRSGPCGWQGYLGVIVTARVDWREAINGDDNGDLRRVWRREECVRRNWAKEEDQRRLARK